MSRRDVPGKSLIVPMWLKPQDMNAYVKVGMVGCGGITTNHIRGAKLLQDAGVCNLEFTACYDVVPDKAKNKAAEIRTILGYEPRTYGSLDEMLRREEEIEAVDICSDHLSHHVLAVQSLQSGRHVIIEKPLGITMKAAHLIVDTAKRNNRVLAVAENYRRMPGNRAINWSIRTGKIGKPRVMMWVESAYNLHFWGWRHDRKKAGGGWILDGGVHTADLMLYDLGPVDEVYAVTRTLEPLKFQDWPSMLEGVPTDVEDLSFAVLRFNSGVTGLWAWTSAAPGDSINHRIIHGDRGSVSWNKGLTQQGQGNLGQFTMTHQELIRQMLGEISEQEKQAFFPGGVGARADPWNFDVSMAIELWDFADSIARGRKPEVDGELGVAAEAIPISIYESATLGEPVKVKDVELGTVDEYQHPLNKAAALE